MENPCLKCSCSANEKATCCGCPERLKWETEHLLKGGDTIPKTITEQQEDLKDAVYKPTDKKK